LQREGRLHTGAAAALEALAGRWPTALATGSTRESALHVLERFGLRRHFDVVVGREDYARDKPAPDAFLRAAELLGVEPPECVVIEDSYKGLTAARAARMCCIVVPNDYTRAGDFRGSAVLLGSMEELCCEVVERAFASVPAVSSP
ncbi:MAG: HAD family hydrolase, partial [Candidatus Binatia bacterium]